MFFKDNMIGEGDFRLKTKRQKTAKEDHSSIGFLSYELIELNAG